MMRTLGFPLVLSMGFAMLLCSCVIYDTPIQGVDPDPREVEDYRSKPAELLEVPPAWLGIDQSPAVTELMAKADAYMDQGAYSEAAQAIERALRLAPQSVAGYEKLAYVRLAQGDFGAAEQSARRALSLIPDLGPSAKARRQALQQLVEQIGTAASDAGLWGSPKE